MVLIFVLEGGERVSTPLHVRVQALPWPWFEHAFMVQNDIIENTANEYQASMVENHGNVYVAFIIKCSVIIDPVSMIRLGNFDVAKHGSLYSYIHT